MSKITDFLGNKDYSGTLAEAQKVWIMDERVDKLKHKAIAMSLNTVKSLI